MSVNKVILLGNVGREPEVRHIDGGNVVASFSLATTDRAYKTQSGQLVPERTEWHNIVAWRGLAEIVEKYVHKGSQVYIEGRLRTRSWVDQSNVQRYTTEIYAENIELLGARRQEPVASTQAQPVSINPSHQSNGQPSQNIPADNSNDDIPF